MKRIMMQAYIKNCDEAIKLYIDAFGAILSSEYRTEDQKVVHAELSIEGHVIALSEAEENKNPGNTMQFCLQYDEGNENLIRRTYDILQKDAEIIYPLGRVFYSPLMADFIDKFGVRWCLFI